MRRRNHIYFKGMRLDLIINLDKKTWLTSTTLRRALGLRDPSGVNKLYHKNKAHIHPDDTRLVLKSDYSKPGIPNKVGGNIRIFNLEGAKVIASRCRASKIANCLVEALSDLAEDGSYRREKPAPVAPKKASPRWRLMLVRDDLELLPKTEDVRVIDVEAAIRLAEHLNGGG